MLSLQQELENFVTIADLYLEYKLALEDIKKRQNRIDAVVKSIFNIVKNRDCDIKGLKNILIF